MCHMYYKYFPQFVVYVFNIYGGSCFLFFSFMVSTFGAWLLFVFFPDEIFNHLVTF